MKQAWTEIYQASRDVLRITFVDPVRDGRPRPDQWPSGLRSAALISGILAALLVFVVAISGWLRSTDVLVQNANAVDVVVPGTTLPLLVVATLVAFALAMTAALHVVWWVRLFLLVVGGATIFTLDAPAMVTPVGVGVVIVGFVVLVVFTLIRSRRTYAWWELPVMLALTAAICLLPLTVLPTAAASSDWRVQVATTVIDSLQLLILPMIIVAGFAPAQVVITGAEAIANRPVSRGLFWTAFGVGVIGLGWSAYQNVNTAAEPLTPQALLATTAVVVGCVGVGVVLVNRSRLRMPPPAALPVAWSNWVNPVAVAMAAVLLFSWGFTAITILLLVTGHPELATALSTAFRDTWTSNLGTIWRGVLGVAALIGSWRLAAARRTAEAVVLGAFGVRTAFGLLSLLPGLDALAQAQPLLIGYAVAGVALGFTLVQVLRRRFDRGRATGVLTVVLIAAFFPYRNALSDPISAVLAVAPTAMLVVGLAWRLATEANITYTTSRSFPQPTRILLFLSSGLLAFASITMVTLTRGLGTAFDTSAWGEMGDIFLGEPLYLAGLIAAFWLMVRPHDRGEVVEQLSAEAYDPAAAASADAAMTWTPPAAAPTPPTAPPPPSPTPPTAPPPPSPTGPAPNSAGPTSWWPPPPPGPVG
ncbi:MAG: hypothetical protein LWW77_10245 [Propionibacteriales bacterium]|nr:hypothetical protein [Propionibacteriales bacterium]